jgi:large subunit ribosomal protein L4
MTIDVVNSENKKVGSVDLKDELFGKRVKSDLIWEAVVHEQAEKRRGTQAAKNRAAVAGSGKKLWKQKGTGRARVSDLRNPLWRKGGIVFAPQPRDYGFALPKKVRKGALREALAFQAQAGALTVVDALAASEIKTKAAAAMLKTLGANGKTLLAFDAQHRRRAVRRGEPDFGSRRDGRDARHRDARGAGTAAGSAGIVI